MSEFSPLFQHLLNAYSSGELNPETFQIRGSIEPPRVSDILDYTSLDQTSQESYFELGQAAIQRGEVGALVLAGGMATRFAFEQPKALYPILDDHTFLELKIESYKPYNIPMYIMTSFHTHQPTLAFLETHNYFGYKRKIFLFQQFRLPRIYPDGTLRKVNDEIEYAASGHGDFVEAFRESQLLYHFKGRGGKYLLFSNIDNLGASVDPTLLGLYLTHEPEMLVEVAAKVPGDKGGAPARVGGRFQIVEEFLFPADFNQDSIQVFNTATYIFKAKVLEREFELPWYVVEKKVEEQRVVQFEHLAGDLSRELEILCVKINRGERFLPVKRRQDAETIQPFLRQKFSSL